MGKQLTGATPQAIAQQGYETPYLGDWRRCAQLTMAAFARRAGVTVRTVFLAEHRERMPQAATVERFAAALGVPSDVLLSYPPTADEAREYVLDVVYRATTQHAPAQSSAFNVLAPVGAGSA